MTTFQENIVGTKCKVEWEMGCQFRVETWKKRLGFGILQQYCSFGSGVTAAIYTASLRASPFNL